MIDLDATLKGLVSSLKNSTAGRKVFKAVEKDLTAAGKKLFDAFTSDEGAKKFSDEVFETFKKIGTR